MTGRSARRAFGVLVAALSSVAARPAPADDVWRVTGIEENDSIVYPTDRHYTQGLRLSLLSSDVGLDDASAPLFQALDGGLFAQPDGWSDASHRVDWSLGQSIFTPTDIFDTVPNPRDRPYAGWLYVGAGMIQDSLGRLDDLEAEIGVVGPWSLAEQTQNDWHQYVVAMEPADGWAYQLHNEPGLDLIYDRKWRLDLAETAPGWGFDLVPDIGGSAGNVMTYANGGAMLRLGHGLDSDYGPPRIQPAQSGTDYFEPRASWGVYAFAGIEGRLVARNIFLDGNTFESSPHVEKLPAVGDLNVGLAVYVGPYLRGTVSFDNRSDEFVGQQDPDRFTSISFELLLPL